MSLTSYQAAPPCIKGRANVRTEAGTVKRPFFTPRASVHGEFEDRRGPVGLTGTKDRVGERGLVRRIRIVLGLEAKAGTVGVRMAAFANRSAVEEIATVELDAGFLGPYFQNPT